MLNKKRVLVIGGSSGFGKHVVTQALAKNARVSVIGRNKDRLDALKETVNRYQIKTYELDATNPEALVAFFNEAGQFDHIVSMLGGAMGGGFLDNKLSTIREAIGAKFFANLQLAKIAIAHLNEGGSLIFTSGSGGTPATASGAVVGNHAINLMVQGLAVEVAPKRRVNAVSPTWTPTGLWRQLSSDEVATQETEFAQQVPLKRVSRQSEVASGYLYLMENQFMTGQILKIDGGVDL